MPSVLLERGASHAHGISSTCLPRGLGIVFRASLLELGSLVGLWGLTSNADFPRAGLVRVLLAPWNIGASHPGLVGEEGLKDCLTVRIWGEYRE